MKDEISRSNKAVDKMRDEVVRLRSKVNELQHEKNDMKKQHESHLADEVEAAAERVTVLMDLRSLLERRNQQLNDIERSRDAIEADRARIQLHSTEVQVTIVSLHRELEEARANALTARTSEEAARLQITRMMDVQLTQSQTIEGLRRQVESSNISAQHAQALLRANQEQQSRMPPPNTSTLVHRPIRVMQNICVLCLAGMIWIHLDRSHQDKSNSRWRRVGLSIY